VSYENVKKWRHNTKLKMIAAFGGRCGHCNIVDHPTTYDFHHLDLGSSKEFNITHQIRSWAILIEEAKKCVMLCGICHRKVHAKVIELAPDILRFDEYLIASTAKLYDACPVCGHNKPHKSKACSLSCAGRLRQKIDWDALDLPSLLKEHPSLLSLSRYLGISDNAIRKQLRKRGL
jgi:hypothetical protein